MINDIKLDDDVVDSLGLWWLEYPTVVLSKFIKTAVHKECKLHEIHIYMHLTMLQTFIYA